MTQFPSTVWVFFLKSDELKANERQTVKTDATFTTEKLKGWYSFLKLALAHTLGRRSVE